MMREALTLLVVLAGLLPGQALALACQSQNTGNWSAPGTWTACGGGIPAAADTVTILGGDNVTVNIANAAATSVQLGLNGAGGNGTLTFSAAGALTVSGTLTFGNGNRNGIVTMTAGGTLSVGDFVFVRGTWTPGTGTVILTATNTLPNNTNIDTFNNVTIASGTTTLSRATTIGGDLAIAAGATWDGNDQAVTLRGDLTDNGAFVSGAGTYTLSGAALQTISGTGGGTTVFDRLTLNNGNNLQLGGTHDLTVSTLLTLTNGVLITNANTVYVSNGSAIASAGGNDFVQGNLKKPFSTGANIARTFEVGTGTTYSPVTVTFASVTTAGDITVSSTAGSHPQLATSGIDTVTPAKLNRWYSIGNSATAPVGFTTYDAAFTYVAGDIDAGAVSSAFIAMRFASGAWNPTTLGGIPTNTLLTATGETGFGDFAIGDGLGSNPLAGSGGRFNAYDPPPLTPAGAINGQIRTKLAGIAFTLTLVHTNAGGTALNNINSAVTVDLMDASNNTGAFTDNCGPNWVVIQSIGTNFPNVNTITVNFTEASAWKEVRVRISSGGQTGCSNDRFAIRPPAFAISSSASNNNSSGAPAIKAGATFTITASYAGYSGTPGIDTTQVVGSPTAGTLSGAFAAAVGGTATGNYTYSEVGNFGLNANAVTDQSFAAVDQPADCTPDFSNALANGRYGCYIGNAAIPQTTGSSGFGRFVPDHFFVAAGATLTNRSAAACAPASTFSYLGEGMALAFTVQARNTALAVTQNYAGTYAKLNPATIAQLGLGASSGATNLTSRLDLSAGSAGSFTAGQAAVTATVGITRAVPDNPDGPFAAAKLGAAPSDSDGVSARAADMNVDVDGVGGNDHVQVGVDTELRFGRLRLQNAFGSEKLALPVPMQAQYWSGGGFITNAQDSCTSIPRSAVALGSYTGALAPAPNCLTFVQQSPITFANGVGTLTMAAPTGGVSGSLLLTPNLGTTAAGSYCSAAGVVPTSPATAAGLGYLLGRWDDAADPDANPNTSYDDKPSSRAAFGLYGAQPGNFIYFRENY